MSRGTEILAGAPAACWRRSAQRRFGTLPETHDELVVLFATHGQMNYLIDGQIARMRPGAMLFAYAGQAHVLLAETRGFDMYVFLISGCLLPPEARGRSLPPLTLNEAEDLTGPRLLPVTARDELKALADALVDETDPERQYLGIRWWLAQAWHHWQQAGTDAAERLHPALDQAARTIKRDPSLSLPELAESVDISPEHLGRLFRSGMGEGFVAFRQRARLDTIDRIIADHPKTTLLDAALEAGFGSYPQFYRAFRALRGCAPYAYYNSSDGAVLTAEAADGAQL